MTTITLSAGVASPWTVPADWGKPWSIAAHGSGGGATGDWDFGMGGGGGGGCGVLQSSNGTSFTVGTTVAFVIGGQGTQGTNNGSTPLDGSDTYLGPSKAGAFVLGSPGLAAQGLFGAVGPGANGGTSASCIGTLKFAGGNGGTGAKNSGGTGGPGGGGGGAGGPDGNGANGVTPATGNNGGAGGDGDGGSGGAGRAGATTSGTPVAAVANILGGGGGAGGWAAPDGARSDGGMGGWPGGGGGGGSNCLNSAGGTGEAGAIIITYTPSTGGAPVPLRCMMGVGT